MINMIVCTARRVTLARAAIVRLKLVLLENELVVHLLDVWQIEVGLGD